MKKIDYSRVESVDFCYPNMELSETFYNKFNGLIKSRECYDNVARIFNSNRSILIDYPGICIVYGGVQIITCDDDLGSNLFVKHCFFKFKDKIIDPTLYKNKSLRAETKYFSVTEYSFDEYLDMLFEYGETSPVSIVKQLNKASLDLFSHKIAYAG
jgi:hypothetical protein